jgi:serine/threonine-protein kinase
MLTRRDPPKREKLIQTAATETNAEISPDGRWVAYQSNDSGTSEIYVRPFPDVNSGRWPVSPDGGTRPAWLRSGKELFYLDGKGRLSAVSVAPTAGGFVAGTAHVVLNTAYYGGASVTGTDLRGYDVAPDGQRFLMIKDAAEPSVSGQSTNVTVVLNWIKELEARVPAAK